MTQQPAIQWGSLEFVHPETQPPAEGYQIHAMAEGTHFDNPKALLQVVKSLLNDGSLAVLEGWDNREVPIRLRLSAPAAVAGPALAAAEAALMRQAQSDLKPPLRQTPSATGAAVNVFDVVAATLDRDTSEGWDLEEERREYRHYLLTLTCLPFVRTDSSVVVPALAAPSTPGAPPAVVDIDTCGSFVNWSQTTEHLSGVTSGSTGGYVFTRGTKSGGPVAGMVVTRTGSIAMGASTTLLQLDIEWIGPPMIHPPSVGFPNGQYADPVASQASPIAGVRYFYEAPASFASFSVYTGDAWGGVAPREVRIHNVARTDSTGLISSTTRQQARSATVSGSAPTQASIRLFDASPSALGSDVLVHTSTNTSWQPPLRRWRTNSAGVTSDIGTISGGRNTLATAMVFRVPAALFTEGVYALMANMQISTAGALNWSTRIVSSTGSATVGSSVVSTGVTPVPTTSGFQVLQLASVPLPVVVTEADQAVEITLNGTANMTFDEGWLFGLHDGALTWIRDVDALSWIDVRSPELAAARASVFGGTGPWGASSTCVDWKCRSFGAHRFNPGSMQIFTVTSASLTSQSEIEFYPRGHSHVQASWVA